jgi:hypothetical protein
MGVSEAAQNSRRPKYGCLKFQGLKDIFFGAIECGHYWDLLGLIFGCE